MTYYCTPKITTIIIILYSFIVLSSNRINDIDIQIVGLARQSEQSILSKSGLLDNNNNIDITKILNNLWSTHFFKDITIDSIDTKGQKKIIIKVLEQPMISKVIYKNTNILNIHNINSFIQKNGLVIHPNTIYDPNIAYKIQSLLLKLAEQNGLINATVNVILNNTNNNTANLLFELNGGNKIQIYQTTLQNHDYTNMYLSKSLIKKYNTFILTKQKIESLIHALKHKYIQNGYKDIIINKPLIITDPIKNKKSNSMTSSNYKISQTKAKLIIPITEGKQYILGNINCNGNDKISNSFIINYCYKQKMNNILKKQNISIHNKKNYPYHSDLINECIKQMINYYYDNGYINTTYNDNDNTYNENLLSNSTNKDCLNPKKVDVNLYINKEEQYKIRYITFEGNLKTKDKVLRRTINMHEGDIYNKNNLQNACLELLQLGYFQIKENPKIDLVENKQQVDITIKGEETGVNKIMFNGGYGLHEGFGLGTSLGTDNFLGRGQYISIELNINKNTNNIAVSYTEPCIFDTPYTLSTVIEKESNNYATNNNQLDNQLSNLKYSSNIINITGHTKLSTFIKNKQWAHFTLGSIGYKLYNTKSINNQNFYITNDNKRQISSSIKSNISYNTSNNPYRPTTGKKISLDIEYGGWQLGSNDPFLITTCTYKWLSNIYKNIVFCINAKYGYMHGSNILNVFHNESRNTVRGYDYIGPTRPHNNKQLFLGGKKQLIMNIENQFRLSNMVDVVIFSDVGQLWMDHKAERYQKCRMSCGIECRLFTPISAMPLRFTWSKKLNKYPFDNQRSKNFDFSIGTYF